MQSFWANPVNKISNEKAYLDSVFFVECFIAFTCSNDLLLFLFFCLFGDTTQISTKLINVK